MLNTPVGICLSISILWFNKNEKSHLFKNSLILLCTQYSWIWLYGFNTNFICFCSFTSIHCFISSLSQSVCVTTEKSNKWLTYSITRLLWIHYTHIMCVLSTHHVPFRQRTHSIIIYSINNSYIYLREGAFMHCFLGYELWLII